MDGNGKMKSVRCDACGQVMFQRRDNTIVTYGFELELAQSRNIRCSCKAGGTRFCVDRQKISVDHSQEKR